MASNVNFSNQPIAPYWFPEEFLQYNPSKDPNLSIIKGVVPLKSRVRSHRLHPVNSMQNSDYKIMSISILNANTSGNPPRGTSNSFDANTFHNWQYVDILVYWGGSSGEGLIVPPTADIIDSAHRNGVPVVGTVFFPQVEHGGRIEWLDQFLQKDSSGQFPSVTKMIEVAKALNFDGWFINQETQTTPEAPLTKEHADLMRELMQDFKSRVRSDLKLVWYDSMTIEGKLAWQNQLNDLNAPFLIDNGRMVSDAMFLNFWWTEDNLAPQDLLKKSNMKAAELGISPYLAFAGIDVQAAGTNTPVKWNLLQRDGEPPFTSMGLYCPSWTYQSSDSTQEFFEKESRLWINEFGDPSKLTEHTGEDWKGVSTYAIEQSVINSYPFSSYFNLGNGSAFFVDGQRVSDKEWNNRSVSDVPPTYQWIVQQNLNTLDVGYDYSDAYYGGNSIRINGGLKAGQRTTVGLYSCDLPLSRQGQTALLWVKRSHNCRVGISYWFHNMEWREDQPAQAFSSRIGEWEAIEFDLYNSHNNPIYKFELIVEGVEDVDDFKLQVGGFVLKNEHTSSYPVTVPQNFAVDNVEFDPESYYAGIKFSWRAVENARYYEIYKLNQDGSKSFQGVTTATSFFLNGLEREPGETASEFAVVAVNLFLERSGDSNTASIQWPANTTPRANFKVSKTLAAPGEAITFQNLSSRNTDSVEWTFEGGTPSTSTEENPVVTFANEGRYTVTLKAINGEGEDVKTVSGQMYIINTAAGQLANLSMNKPASASSYVNESEAPRFAVDGSLGTKWCAVGPAPHFITVDLEELKTVGEVYIAHAQAGNESAASNTRSYTIETSKNGVDYTLVTEVTDNTAGETVDTFRPDEIRYVRLTTIQPTQGADPAARIYELHVRGLA